MTILQPCTKEQSQQKQSNKNTRLDNKEQKKVTKIRQNTETK